MSKVVVAALMILVAQAFGPASAQRLGTIDFPTSGSAKAQPHFLRGVAALHSFEYRGSARCVPAGADDRPGIRDGILGRGDEPQPDAVEPGGRRRSARRALAARADASRTRRSSDNTARESVPRSGRHPVQLRRQAGAQRGVLGGDGTPGPYLSSGLRSGRVLRLVAARHGPARHRGHRHGRYASSRAARERGAARGGGDSPEGAEGEPGAPGRGALSDPHVGRPPACRTGAACREDLRADRAVCQPRPAHAGARVLLAGSMGCSGPIG